MNWNRSTLYALSVGILARQIAGGPGVQQAPPADDEPISRDTVIDIQTRLARLGLYKDDTDGLLGPRPARRCVSSSSRPACRPTAIPRPRRCASFRPSARHQERHTKRAAKPRQVCRSVCRDAANAVPLQGLGATSRDNADGVGKRARIAELCLAPVVDDNEKLARRSRRRN